MFVFSLYILLLVEVVALEFFFFSKHKTGKKWVSWLTSPSKWRFSSNLWFIVWKWWCEFSWPKVPGRMGCLQTTLPNDFWTFFRKTLLFEAAVSSHFLTTTLTTCSQTLKNFVWNVPRKLSSLLRTIVLHLFLLLFFLCFFKFCFVLFLTGLHFVGTFFTNHQKTFRIGTNHWYDCEIFKFSALLCLSLS